jgi:hypothetical protein
MASAFPSATRFAQTRMDELRLRRSGASALSVMSTTSRASAIEIRGGTELPSVSRSTSSRPTSVISTFGYSSAASSAPLTISPGA